MLETLFNRLEEIYPKMVEIRRELHMNPELSFQEVQTPKYISKFLQELGLDVKTGVGGRGVVAKLTGGHPGKTVAIRADFDALPIQEQTDLPFQSKISGIMHACGHDAHTAIALGLAKVFTEKRDQLKGNIVFIHQHAEEVLPGGAKAMIEDGCLDGVDVIFATHMENDYPVGTIGYRSGYIMSCADEFYIEVLGKGGHAQAPHHTKDALVVGAQLVCNLQHIVSRRVNPLKSAVVSVGSFHSGTATNIVNGEAKITGEVRAFEEEIRTDLEKIIEEITSTTCQAARSTYTYTYLRGYPSTYNHPDITKLLVDSAKEVIDEKNIKELEPMMGAEDFAYYTQKIPGTYFFTGSANPEDEIVYPYHHPKFKIDERAILVASKVLAAATIQYLHGEK
ncbi:M20 metallopeptidase family protein [Pseudobacillus wudalianchiensis]|uniref:Peptidase M20 n=1 Tax=Pseudobacillus wudalianchiensis TaxID=1743143 RepID=A0A1B9B2I6_9BACI|nr:M20 family metallopeptidase [Bacillus wudalianchiensis]OCA90302.1 peptidase M20 [Bacillus wudalianchiensis]